MEDHQFVTLKNGMSCLIRNANGEDVKEVLRNFYLVHQQTDYLYSYPDEHQISLEEEIAFLNKRKEHKKEVFMVAIIHNQIVGTAGIASININAVSLYKKLGFVEYGRNPKGFLSRTQGYQELISMRLELSKL